MLSAIVWMGQSLFSKAQRRETGSGRSMDPALVARRADASPIRALLARYRLPRAAGSAHCGGAMQPNPASARTTAHRSLLCLDAH